MSGRVLPSVGQVFDALLALVAEIGTEVRDWPFLIVAPGQEDPVSFIGQVEMHVIMPDSGGPRALLLTGEDGAPDSWFQKPNVVTAEPNWDPEQGHKDAARIYPNEPMQGES